MYFLYIDIVISFWFVCIGLDQNGLQRHHSLPTQLSYEVTHESYTKGIDIQQFTLPGQSLIIMITISLHFERQSDSCILSKVMGEKVIKL